MVVIRLFVEATPRRLMSTGVRQDVFGRREHRHTASHKHGDRDHLRTSAHQRLTDAAVTMVVKLAPVAGVHAARLCCPDCESKEAGHRGALMPSELIWFSLSRIADLPKCRGWDISLMHLPGRPEQAALGLIIALRRSGSGR